MTKQKTTLHRRKISAWAFSIFGFSAYCYSFCFSLNCFAYPFTEARVADYNGIPSLYINNNPFPSIMYAQAGDPIQIDFPRCQIKGTIFLELR